MVTLNVKLDIGIRGTIEDIALSKLHPKNQDINQQKLQ